MIVGVAVLLAATLGTAALGIVSTPEPADPVVVSVSATADGRIELVHEAGPSLEVDRLTVRILVDGTPLDHQPPVPFFSAAGFVPGPTGPFNSATDPTWDPGERATLEVADTNSPSLDRGSKVTVRIIRGEVPVAEVESTVE